MLTKLVDGKTITLSDTEERQQRGYWALNDKYPEYSGHCGWDGVNEPSHNMMECRKHHQRLTTKALDLAKADLNKQIEIAEEAGDEAIKKGLLMKRSALRAHENQDLSNCQTVEDLRARIHSDLKPYWSS